MGCGSSSPSWQKPLVAEWTVYKLARTQLTAGEHTLDVSAPSGEKIMWLRVTPYKNAHGHVSMQAMHPYAVEFATPIEKRTLSVAVPPDTCPGMGIPVVVDGTSHIVAAPDDVVPGSTVHFEVHAPPPCPSYDRKKLQLTGLLTYNRVVTKSRYDGPSDTIWRTEQPADVAGAMPRAIAVENGGGRVAVWDGPVPVNRARGPTDLLACISRANSGEATYHGSPLRHFQLRVHPKLSAELAKRPGALAQFTAIATEGFWSKGSACFAASDKVGVQAASNTEVLNGGKTAIQFFAPSRALALRQLGADDFRNRA